MKVEFVLFELFTLGGVPLLMAWVWRRYRRNAKLRARGAHARGTVLRKEHLRHGDGFEEHESTRCILHYSFSLPDGTVLQHTYEDHFMAWTGMSPGSQIDVAYWPEAPRHSLPENGGVNGPLFSACSALALIMMCAGLYGLVDHLWEGAPPPFVRPPPESQMRPLQQ
ncbi:DUF3592 domain-containing protein [Corallococcus sp. bb12-1]|uniref:DUF3592 domain-containing protein n=1 Tax=Corallococcus sp. bb12-1 TaxID=2996784 RepID=UPI0022717DED|nr:DUF3592 domain-containing protein [Corallococcus sp. bb12-1]MCY1040595.1 DUF3592 domain-containing protein [Corallococcus sp. bb12-1]